MNERLEIWGGVECTVNRVGDTWFDQMKYNGHDQRIEDLDRFAAIGLRTLRYPFLWERIAPDGVERADWSWADERLARLRALGIRPIAGLVHHGSGPACTDLMDPAFGEKLARYARAFAERYPWVEDYTPINEPLTTARFSALYGVWYPHLRDTGAFLRALLHECRATVLAMREARAVNPRARLVQTDDLGRCTSTARLRYQAEFENERRWLGFDLLCGRVTREHPLFWVFAKAGIPDAEVLWFADNPCPPDIVGINHYLLSSRHLDERLERYPEWSHGGNEREAYADVETVRIGDVVPPAPAEVFREAWERYHLPLAVTEVHLDASREDQVRWLLEIWRSAQQLRKEGVDFRAVTVWGLLGHYDWHCLVSRCEGHYEPGVFDLRAPEPRPTMLADAIRSLAETGTYDHPVLSVPGWWRRPERALHPVPVPPPEPLGPGSHEVTVSGAKVRPLLVTGGRGTLGTAFARVLEARGVPYRLVSRDELDICDRARVEQVLDALRPWAVVNAAGYVRVDDAESEVERCRRANVIGPRVLARACAARGIRLVTFSSDLVFDGATEEPYVETSEVRPLNVYGRTKAEGERAVLAGNPDALIVRASSFFGPWDAANFVTATLRALARGEEVRALSDVRVSPTYLPDLAHTTLNLLMDGEHGLWHLANAGEISWHELATEAARIARLDVGRVVPVRLDEVGWPAARPRYSVLDSERGRLLPSLDRALDRYFAQAKVAA